MHIYHCNFYTAEARAYIKHPNPIRHGLSRPKPFSTVEIAAPSKQAAQDKAHLTGLALPGAASFELIYKGRLPTQ